MCISIWLRDISKNSILTENKCCLLRLLKKFYLVLYCLKFLTWHRLLNCNWQYIVQAAISVTLELCNCTGNEWLFWTQKFVGNNLNCVKILILTKRVINAQYNSMIHVCHPWVNWEVFKVPLLEVGVIWMLLLNTDFLLWDSVNLAQLSEILWVFFLWVLLYSLLAVSCVPSGLWNMSDCSSTIKWSSCMMNWKKAFWYVEKFWKQLGKNMLPFTFSQILEKKKKQKEKTPFM